MKKQLTLLCLFFSICAIAQSDSIVHLRKAPYKKKAILSIGVNLPFLSFPDHFDNFTKSGEGVRIVSAQRRLGYVLNLSRLPNYNKRISFSTEAQLRYYRDVLEIQYIYFDAPSKRGSWYQLSNPRRDLYLGVAANINTCLSKKEKIFLETGILSEFLVKPTLSEGTFDNAAPSTTAVWREMEFGYSGGDYFYHTRIRVALKLGVSKTIFIDSKPKYLFKINYDIPFHQFPKNTGVKQQFLQLSFGCAF